MNIEDIAVGVFEILDGTNHGFFKSFAKVNNGLVSLFYEKKDSVEPFLEINIPKKSVYFYTSPKSQLAEKSCRKLVEYLKAENFKVSGVCSFVDKPHFKPHEISLY